MGFFLASRFFNGNLLYYIGERFVWLMLLAAVGFIIVGVSYHHRPVEARAHDHDGHTHSRLS